MNQSHFETEFNYGMYIGVYTGSLQETDENVVIINPTIKQLKIYEEIHRPTIRTEL